MVRFIDGRRFLNSQNIIVGRDNIYEYLAEYNGTTFAWEGIWIEDEELQNPKFSSKVLEEERRNKDLDDRVKCEVVVHIDVRGKQKRKNLKRKRNGCLSFMGCKSSSLEDNDKGKKRLK